MATNNSSLLSADRDQHIFDIPHIRILLTILYTIVFIFCCVGNLAVVLVVIFHSRMRNMTKFLLGNLSFANLCVGIFCIYQSLTTYLYESWFYGDFMCRMHHFTQSLCHTASVLVLVAIAVERYLVLLHPFKSRQMMTFRKLAALITVLWISSAAIASPRLYYFGTIKIRINRHRETICIPKKTLYDSATADTIYFVLLYVFPLTVISVLYARIAKHLHNSVALRKGLEETGQRERQGCTQTSVQYDGRESARIQPFRLIRSSKGAILGCRRHRSLSFSSSSASASGNCSETHAENGTSKAKGAFPWRLSNWKLKPKCRNDTDVTFTDPMEFQPETMEVLDKHEVLASRRSKIICTQRSTWPRYETGSCMSRSSTDPRLNATSAPWKHKNTDGIEGTDRSVKNEQGTETLTTSSSGHLALCQFQSHATRIQLNQRLHAIRVLIVIVVTFAVLNLPFHVRKLCLNYLPSYDADSDVNHLLTPLTFLLMYANCAISPILYAFLNKRFRQSFLDLIFMRQRRRGNAGHGQENV